MLLAAPDVRVATLPDAGGAVGTELVIPYAPALFGTVVHHQVVALELDAAGVIMALTSTNSLELNVGVF